MPETTYRKDTDMDWTIFTPGPIMPFNGTLEQAKGYVEAHAPLKRGWTHQWMRTGPATWTCRRINSKGNEVKGYGITIREGALR